MFNTVRWALALPLAILGIYVIASNFSGIAFFVLRGKHSSLVPLIGAGLLSLSMLTAPMSGLGQCAWLPFVLDPGCCLLFSATAVYLLWHICKR
jgi:hypothetical protein